METLMPIRAVMFDLGGVLLYLPDPSVRYAKWEKLLGLQPGELIQILRRSGFNIEADIGKLTEQAMVHQLSIVLGLDEQQARQFLDEHSTHFELNRELTSFIECLRPRYKTAILSNAWPDAPKKIQERYHFDNLMDTILYSCEVGVAKPETSIYHLACQRLGVRPEEVVFIDDTLRNVEGAQCLGIRSVLFHNNTQAIAEVQAYLDLLPYNGS
jgi:epoxide hydrolase-like predicted phosphatase